MKIPVVRKDGTRGYLGEGRSAKPNRSFWTPARDAALKRMWADPSHSASTIARELRAASRNAVIGRAHRLKLPPKAVPPRLETKRSVAMGLAAKGKTHQQIARELDVPKGSVSYILRS